MTRAWIWRRLTHNIGWKLASLSLAILLWYAVEGEPELVTIQSVPLLYRNLPERLVLRVDAPDQVRAELRGASGRLTRETLADVVAAIDLAGVTGPAAQTFTLSEADFSLPQGVTFLRAVPSQVSLRFERNLPKTVPVDIQFSGSLPSGYRLAEKSVTPALLTVAGPETNVTAIESVKTDPIDLGGRIQTADLKVNAFVEDARVHFESPSVVTVHLTIEKSDAH